MKRYSLHLQFLAVILFVGMIGAAPSLLAIGGIPEVSTAVSPKSSCGQVAVDNTATLITAAKGRHSLVIRNVGAADVYIGFDNTVTASTGFLLQAAGKEAMALDRTTSAVYAITSSGNSTVSYLKE